MEHQHYVLGFLFSTDGTQVALIKKNKPAWQKGKLNGIGGKVELTPFTPGLEEVDKYCETPYQAMVREFQEETGVLIEIWEDFCCLTGGDFFVTVFRAFSEEIKNVKTTTDEVVGIYAVNNVPHLNVISNLNWLIPLALDFEVAPDITFKYY